MKKGFTIIKLLVVGAIIVLFASVLFVIVNDRRARAHDVIREVDIKEIQNAINLYGVNNHAFPVCGTEVVVNGSTDCLSAQLLAAGAMPRVPVDPSGRAIGAPSDCGTSPAVYMYCYISDGTSYTLRYHLETNSIQGKGAEWQSVGP